MACAMAGITLFAFSVASAIAHNPDFLARHLVSLRPGTVPRSPPTPPPRGGCSGTGDSRGVERTYYGEVRSAPRTNAVNSPTCSRIAGSLGFSVTISSPTPPSCLAIRGSKRDHRCIAIIAAVAAPSNFPGPPRVGQTQFSVVSSRR